MQTHHQPGHSVKRVAIVVPFPDRPVLTADEQISLRHLERHLGHYDRFIVAPEGLEIGAYPGYRVLPFPRRFFGSAIAHGSLVMSPRFYEAFAEYEYMLLYHLDALVFRDELLEWCSRDFDFIGAPWFQIVAPGKFSEELSANGAQGGFSLRRVRAFLEIVRSRRPSVAPAEYWRRITSGQSLIGKAALIPRWAVKQIPMLNSPQWEQRRYWHDCEDLFLVERGRDYYPAFRVATAEEALPFAFDVNPEICFELNGRRMPFGAHGWLKPHRRAFWEPYLIRDAEPAEQGRLPHQAVT